MGLVEKLVRIGGGFGMGSVKDTDEERRGGRECSD